MRRKELDNILRNLLVAGNIVTVSFDTNEEYSQGVKPICEVCTDRDY